MQVVEIDSDIEILSDKPVSIANEQVILLDPDDSSDNVRIVESPRKNLRKRLRSNTEETIESLEEVQVLGSSRTNPRIVNRPVGNRRIHQNNNTRHLDMPVLGNRRFQHYQPPAPPVNNVDTDEAIARRLQEQEYSTMQPFSFHEQQRRMRDVLGSFIEWQGMQLPINEFLGLQSRMVDRGNYVQDDNFDTSYESLLALGERIGSAQPTGLPKAMFSKFNTKCFSKKDHVLGEQQCVICLSDYESREKLMELGCKHWFHKKCIQGWFKNSKLCPM